MLPSWKGRGLYQTHRACKLCLNILRIFTCRNLAKELFWIICLEFLQSESTVPEWVQINRPWKRSLHHFLIDISIGIAISIQAYFSIFCKFGCPVQVSTFILNLLIQPIAVKEVAAHRCVSNDVSNTILLIGVFLFCELIWAIMMDICTKCWVPTW